MTTDFVQKWGKIAYPPALIALAFRNGMGYRYVNWRVNSGNDALYIVLKFCEIRSSNSRVDRTHLRTSAMTRP